LRAFANSADLQQAFSARPFAYKRPYYWKHNTQPGDPANPRWVIDRADEIHGVRFRYDAGSNHYVQDSNRLKSGRPWQMSSESQQRSLFVLREFKVVRLSLSRYRVIPSDGEVDTFVHRAGCWTHAEHWETESIVYCKWPKQCQECREWEEGDHNSALCRSIGKGRL
jgi:hypothetical protein